jgi:hypothetical protein
MAVGWRAIGDRKLMCFVAQLTPRPLRLPERYACFLHPIRCGWLKIPSPGCNKRLGSRSSSRMQSLAFHSSIRPLPHAVMLILPWPLCISTHALTPIDYCGLPHMPLECIKRAHPHAPGWVPTDSTYFIGPVVPRMPAGVKAQA